MKPSPGAATSLLSGANALPVWRTPCRVWGQRMHCGTFDRWLYLRLHRFGLIGRGARDRLRRFVRPGMTVVDVGGNIGLYTVFLARLAAPGGRVLVFEPDAQLVPYLRQNCAENGVADVVRVNALALGAADGILSMRKAVLNSGDNHVGEPSGAGSAGEIRVPVAALDSFAPGLRADFAKIDVQGWELHVLRGMQRTLEANPGIEVLFEYWPDGCQRAGYDAPEMIDFLRGLGFEILATDGAGPLSDAEVAALTRRLQGRFRFTDLLARRKR